MSDEPRLASVLEAFDREGYAVVEGLLDTRALETARRGVAAALMQTPFGRDDFEGRRIRPPFMGYVDGVHPRKLLHKRTVPRSAVSSAVKDS